MVRRGPVLEAHHLLMKPGGTQGGIKTLLHRHVWVTDSMGTQLFLPNGSFSSQNSPGSYVFLLLLIKCITYSRLWKCVTMIFKGHVCNVLHGRISVLFQKPSVFHLCEATAHKDRENKLLPPVRGRLFEKLQRRNV